MPYQDLTTVWDSDRYKTPIFAQDYENWAENDHWLKTNNWAIGTKAVICQATAPLGWIIDTSQHDKHLRVVSGIGGGSGGTHLVSSTIVLAHSAHSINTNPLHSHTLNAHGHTMNTAGSNATTGTPSAHTVNPSGDGQMRISNPGGGSSAYINEGTMELIGNPATTGVSGHNHGGNTITSALSDVLFQYIDINVVTINEIGNTYTDMRGQFSTKQHIKESPDIYELGDNDVYLNANTTQDGTFMLWYDTSAPNGWTQDAVTHGMCLRVRNSAGAGGTGGSFALWNNVQTQHDHDTSSDGGHTHTIPNHDHRCAARFQETNLNIFGYVLSDGTYLRSYDGASANSQNAYWNTTNVDGGHTPPAIGGHTHTIGQTPYQNLLFNHYNVMRASKDTGGGGYTFTVNVHTFYWRWKKLWSYQRARMLADNDAYIKERIPQSGSSTIFYQATAPLNWTQNTTNDNMFLRVSNGSTGFGPGTVWNFGTHGPSTTWALQHNHSISNYQHNHSLNSHSHSLKISNQANCGALWLATGNYIKLQTPNLQHSISGIGSGAASLTDNNTNNGTGTTDDDDHDHGGTTGDALSDVNLAYIDVVLCQKN